MKNWTLALLIFLEGEVLALGIFYAVRRIFKMQKSDDPVLAVFSGMLERLIILTGLYLSVTQIVAMFAGFKVATRLSPQSQLTEDEGRTTRVKKTNEYFLAGNLLSVGMALAYYWIYLRLRTH